MTATAPTGVGSFEAAQILGVTYRQLDYWLRTIFRWDDQWQPGSGGRRRFDVVDLRRMAVVARVYSAVPAPRCRQVALDAIRVADENPEVDVLSWDGQIVRPEHGTDGVAAWLYARRGGMARTRPTLTFFDLTLEGTTTDADT